MKQGSSSTAEGNVQHQREQATDIASAEMVNKSNNMLIQEKQQPGPGQVAPLPTARRMSTIPKTNFSPAHQQEGVFVFCCQSTSDIPSLYNWTQEIVLEAFDVTNVLCLFIGEGVSCYHG